MVLHQTPVMSLKVLHISIVNEVQVWYLLFQTFCVFVQALHAGRVETVLALQRLCSVETALQIVFLILHYGKGVSAHKQEGLEALPGFHFTLL